MNGAYLGLLAIILISAMVGAVSFIVWRFHPHPVTRWLPTVAGLVYYVLNFRVPAPSVLALQNHTPYPLGDGLRVLSLVPALGIGVTLVVLLFLAGAGGSGVKMTPYLIRRLAYPGMPAVLVDIWADKLGRACEEAQINTPQRLAHFLAQVRLRVAKNAA